MISRRRLIAGGVGLGLSSGALTLPLATRARATALARQAASGLDLPSLVLAPEDVEMAGTGVFQLRRPVPVESLFGEYLTMPTRISGDPPSRFVDRLLDAGWVGECRSTVSPPGERQYSAGLPPESLDPEWRPPLPALEIFSRVVEFADADGARAGMPVARDAYDREISGSPQLEPPVKLDLRQTIGDESHLYSVIYALDGGRPGGVFRLVFRVQRLIGLVEGLDYVGGEDRKPLVEQAAARMAERFAAVLSGGAGEPGLFGRVVRLAGDDLRGIGFGGYYLRAGDLVPLFGESADQTRARREAYAGAVNVVAAVQYGDGQLPPNHATVRTDLREFADTETAVGWARLERQAAMVRLAAVSARPPLVPDPPESVSPSRAIGEHRAILSRTFLVDDFRLHRTITLVQDGPFVFTLTVNAIAATPPITAIEDLAELQVEALRAGGPAMPAPVPDGLFG